MGKALEIAVFLICRGLVSGKVDSFHPPRSWRGDQAGAQALPVQLQSLICKGIFVAVHLPLMDKLLLTPIVGRRKPLVQGRSLPPLSPAAERGWGAPKTLGPSPSLFRQGLGSQERKLEPEGGHIFQAPTKCPALGQALSHLFPDLIFKILFLSDVETGTERLSNQPNTFNTTESSSHSDFNTGVLSHLCAVSISPSVLSNSCDPMDCSPSHFSVHGILLARILEWVAIAFSRGSSHPGIKPTSPALQADSLPFEPPSPEYKRKGNFPMIWSLQ